MRRYPVPVPTPGPSHLLLSTTRGAAALAQTKAIHLYRAADRAPGPLSRHCGTHGAASGGSAETARQAAQSGKRVRSDQPRYRSERDPADRPDVTRKPKGLRGPTANTAAHREGREGLRGIAARTRLLPCADGERPRRPCARLQRLIGTDNDGASWMMKIRSRWIFYPHFSIMENRRFSSASPRPVGAECRYSAPAPTVGGSYL